MNMLNRASGYCRVSLYAASVTLSLAACSGHQEQPKAPPAKVSVVTLKAENVPLTLDLPGRTSAVQIAEVRPQVSGVILKRLFKEGTDVKEGQQLYQIDPATYQAAYDKATAAAATAEALAKRYKPLSDAHAVSKQQYEDAAATAREASAEVEQAAINLRYTRVLAPISGRVGRSSVTPGALVTDGQATSMATITQMAPIYVDITEATSDLLRLRRDLADGRIQKTASGAAKVTLSLDDGSTYDKPGELQFSEVTVDQGTGTVALRAIFPNDADVLLPGMFVHAHVDEGSIPDGILVPQAGVQRDTAGKPFVFLVNKDGKVEQRSIDAQRVVGTNWLVGGLKAGDKVITQGIQAVHAGDPVTEEAADTGHPGASEHMTTNDPTAQ